MNQFIKKKSLSIFLALALVLALSMSAFAAWPSFQNTNYNNGIIGATPPTAAPTVKTLGLPISGTTYAGVDTTSIINSGTAYTINNGGANGALIQATDLASGDALWNVELFDSGASSPADGHAINDSQLSTPYIDATNGIIYAAKTYFVNQLSSTGTTGWYDASGDPLTSFAFPGNATTVIHYNGLVVPSDYWAPQLTFGFSTHPGDDTLTVDPVLSNGTTTIDFGESDYYGGDLTAYNGSDSIVPAGTYTLTVTVVNNSSVAATADTAVFDVSYWALYTLSSLTAAAPTIARVANGYGQAATPVSFDDSNVYWGIYEGDRSYYQYAKGGATAAVAFNANDDFYGAGAYSNGTNVFFGSDGSKLYVQGAVGFARPMTSVDLTTIQADAGAVRSTIAFNGTTFFFTSRGTGAVGYLWQTDPSTLASVALALPGNSTSTPVATANSRVYVGWFGYDASFNGIGGVVGVPTGNFVATALFDVYGNGAGTGSAAGDPVQSSPIVYTSGDVDYIYFTTNSGSGKGYCYSYDLNSEEAEELWAAGGTSSNPYALQGFASDGGYLVYGDDGNYLYIMH